MTTRENRSANARWQRKAPSDPLEIYKCPIPPFPFQTEGGVTVQFFEITGSEAVGQVRTGSAETRTDRRRGIHGRHAFGLRHSTSPGSSLSYIESARNSDLPMHPFGASR